MNEIVVILGSLFVASLGTIGFFFLRWVENKVEIARLKKENENAAKINAESERKHSEEIECLRSENSKLRQENDQQKVYLQNNARDKALNQK